MHTKFMGLTLIYLNTSLTFSATMIGKTRNSTLSFKGEVMKIRENRKLLSYPKFEEDLEKLMYQKVLLFYPLKNDVTVENEIIQLFNQVAGCDDSDNKTVVELVER